MGAAGRADGEIVLKYLYGVLFVAFAAYAKFGNDDNPFAIYCMIIAIGLFLDQRWAEAAIFGSALYDSIYVMDFFYRVFAFGVPGGDFAAVSRAARPVILYCGFGVFMWWLVRRYFRSKIDHDELSSHFS